MAAKQGTRSDDERSDGDDLLRPLVCARCGAALTVSADQYVVTCTYCKQSHALLPPPPAEPAETAFDEGDAVAVEWHMSWWPATVVRVEGSRAWRIHYDGWSDAHDEIVGPERIRHRDAPSPARTTVRAGSRRARGTAPSGDRSAPRRASWGRRTTWGVTLVVLAAIVLALVLANRGADSRHQPPTNEAGEVGRTYRRGEPVDIYWGHRWWSGRILEVHRDGTYRITYDGYGSQWDETVEASRLRPHAPSTP